MDILNLNNSSINVDVSHKQNTKELSNWLMQLKFTKQELNNLIKLCNNSIKNEISDKEMLLQFEKKNQENDNLLSVLNKYMSLRDHIAECEDTQCDTSYLEEHEIHKKNYLYHLDKYRKLKDRFYVEFSNELSN